MDSVGCSQGGIFGTIVGRDYGSLWCSWIGVGFACVLAVCFGSYAGDWLLWHFALAFVDEHSNRGLT